MAKSQPGVLLDFAASIIRASMPDPRGLSVKVATYARNIQSPYWRNTCRASAILRISVGPSVIIKLR